MATYSICLIIYGSFHRQLYIVWEVAYCHCNINNTTAVEDVSIIIFWFVCLFNSGPPSFCLDCKYVYMYIFMLKKLFHFDSWSSTCEVSYDGFSVDWIEKNGYLRDAKLWVHVWELLRTCNGKTMHSYMCVYIYIYVCMYISLVCSILSVWLWPNVRREVFVEKAQLKPDGTRWRTVGEVKGKHASGVGSQ